MSVSGTRTFASGSCAEYDLCLRMALGWNLLKCGSNFYTMLVVHLFQSNCEGEVRMSQKTRMRNEAEACYREKRAAMDGTEGSWWWGELINMCNNTTSERCSCEKQQLSCKVRRSLFMAVTELSRHDPGWKNPTWWHKMKVNWRFWRCAS